MTPDRYFVLGNPVAHSHSPFIHAAFAAQTQQQFVYDRRLCPLDGFAEAVRSLAADTAGGPVRGCNVTVPFKLQALRLAGQVSARARLAGAANVLSFDPQGWQADNTDGAGLVQDLIQHAQWDVRGQRVLLIGAGGAAAGVLGPLLAVDLPTHGDYYTINRGGMRLGNPATPYAHVHGAGFRAIYNLDDLDASLFVVAPGQSGHPLSAHWRDLAPLWAEGRHVRLAANRHELLAGTRALVLLPTP